MRSDDVQVEMAGRVKKGVEGAFIPLSPRILSLRL
jgi:hypothetical protein